jgi:hypothetical protein
MQLPVLLSAQVPNALESVKGQAGGKTGQTVRTELRSDAYLFIKQL